MIFSPVTKSVMILLTCLVLAGCKSDSERADDYFQSGMELLQAGDTDRAIVEFRNVFEFEPNHLETRMVMGNLFLEQNNPGAAYGQFLRVAEQYPREFEARRTLAELAFAAGDWGEFERHGAVAVEIQREDPRVQAIDLGIKYRTSILEEDFQAVDALTVKIEALLNNLPDSNILNNLLVDSYARNGRIDELIARLDVLIAQRPDDRQPYIRRLAALTQMQDLSAIEAQLREMVTRFPGDLEVQRMTFSFYVQQQRLDEAEAFLREISDPADEDPGLFLSLIQLVSQTKGEEAARVEIQRAIDVNPRPNPFKAMLAMLDFQAGERDKAIADIEAALTDADPTADDTHMLKTTLARMLVETGNQVGARRLVEEVLAQNPSNVDALKMQATWRLEADEVDEAIADLRVVLDMAPEDIQAMNLMYEAYIRRGDPDLARDYLAQAVDVSGNALEPSLRYARVLIREERYLPAEDVLIPALRQNPRDIQLLALLGQVYLRLDDTPRATQVIDTLLRSNTDEARALANSLQAELLNREDGTEEAMAFLEDLAAGEEALLRDQLVLIRARLKVGDVEEARSIAEKLVAEYPKNLDLKLVLASALIAEGELEGAEATLREITAAAPHAPKAWMQLTRVAARQGDLAKVEMVIEEALVATKRHPNLLWAKAGLLERKGDIDEAIAIYEDLYAQNSGSIILANNLASLLGTYKYDENSLERAWVVGRRLKGLDAPALQDTYGWLLYRQGSFEEALPYLESAASALDDPIVQAHLGFVYLALGRNEEALTQLQRAVVMAGPGDTRERIELARAELTRMRDLPEN